MSLRLTFLGGAGTVTGSKTLVESAAGARVLVDCGMFQGFKHLRLKNREPFEVPPSSINAVVLTHAHLDHSGWLPVLVRAGFAGKIWCTDGTKGLVEILLLDAARLEEEQASWLKRKKKSKHEDPQPLFTSQDAEGAIEKLVAVPAGSEAEVAPGISARFMPGGHILGAGSVRILESSGGRSGASVLFSGDVGRPNDLLMRPPQVPPPADLLVLESTYGARRHEEKDAKSALADVIRRTVERRGIVMIPAFAVGRAQALLHVLRELFDEGVVPRVPVYMNSPMATDVTKLSCSLHEELRVDDRQCHLMCTLAEYVKSTEQSKALNQKGGPMVVIAGSGMMTGGRILHHLAAWGSDPRNTIVLVGYQAPGTRGASLLGGAPSLRLFGDDVPMRAEVVRLDMLSGHADADELIAWVRSFPWRPQQVLLNHGEPEASDILRQRLERELGLPSRVVVERDRVDVAPAASNGDRQPGRKARGRGEDAR